jgi:hypothetical protein
MHLHSCIIFINKKGGFSMRPQFLIFTLIFLCLGFSPAGAKENTKAGKEVQDESEFDENLNYAQVVFVTATKKGGSPWRFDVTVRHNDEGWEHYADSWQVINPTSEEVLAERVLAHPHDTEQPFTRSLGDIKIPSGLTHVRVRAKCNIHGFGGREVTVILTKERGEDFQVIMTDR